MSNLKYGYHRTRPDGTTVTVNGYPSMAKARAGVALALVDNQLATRTDASTFARSLRPGEPETVEGNTFRVYRVPNVYRS